MWEFGNTLLFIHIWPDSLLLPALFGLTVSVASVFGGPIIGDLVDRSLLFLRAHPGCDALD